MIVADNDLTLAGSGSLMDIVSPIALTRVVVQDNVSDGTLFFFQNGGLPYTLENWLVVGNQSSGTSRIAAVRMEHFTVADNTVSFGVFSMEGGSISDSVFANNGALDAYYPELVVANSDFFATGNVGIAAGSSGVTFVDPILLPDYHLDAASPAVDAGTLGTFDPDGTRADQGYFGGPEAP